MTTKFDSFGDLGLKTQTDAQLTKTKTKKKNQKRNKIRNKASKCATILPDKTGLKIKECYEFNIIHW